MRHPNILKEILETSRAMNCSQMFRITTPISSSLFQWTICSWSVTREKPCDTDLGWKLQSDRLQWHYEEKPCATGTFCKWVGGLLTLTWWVFLQQLAEIIRTMGTPRQHYPSAKVGKLLNNHRNYVSHTSKVPSGLLLWRSHRTLNQMF